MKKKIIFFFFALNIGFFSYSQGLLFQSLIVNDGLTQNDVSCILQDSYGFIWIGTYDGLNRFDGFNVLNFFHQTDNDESLRSNRILSLFEDSKKRIWIGTDGNGLNYYSLILEKFIRVKTPDGYNQITNIIENKSGEIYITTSNGVLKIVEDNIVRAELLQLPITGLYISDVIFSKGETIIFSTSHGLWTLKDKVCKQIEGTEKMYCRKLISDKNGNLWCGIDGKLIVIKKNKYSFKIEQINSFPVNIIRSICESNNGSVWIGTSKNGLYEINPTDYSIIQHIKYDALNERGILSNSILSLYCDKSNTLWVGTRRGICYTNLSQKKFRHISFEDLSNVVDKPHIRTLAIDEDYLYYGIQNRGCFRYSLKNKKSEKIFAGTTFDPLFLSKIRNQIYVGTDNGILIKGENDPYLKRYKLLAEKSYNSSVIVTSICEDGQGNIYFGTFSGIITKLGDNNTEWLHNLYPQTKVLQGKRVFSLLHDKDASCIWIGTISDGLFKLNLTKDGQFISLETYNQSMQNDYHIANNSIWSFFKGIDGTLWIGTDAGLLYKTKKSNRITQLNLIGIVDKKIMGIVEDDLKNLWLTNSLGLIRFNTKNRTVKRYTYNDGLQSSTFTEAIGKASDGTLYFGSINGIDFINPSKILVNSHKSSVAISDFKVHNISITPGGEYFGRKVLDKSINLTHSITLSHKQNNFLFEFTVTDYSNSYESNFRYKLDGYDHKWIYTGKHRFVSYSNLKPGNYTFWVDAANNDGIWNDSPKKIEINILPAPWFSLWAYLFYLILVVGIVLAFVFFLDNRQKLRHQIGLKNIEYNKDKEINELKLMFFTDVAHEFKTPLSLIVGPFNELITNKITEEHRDFCYKIISRNTKRMIFLVNQLLDFRKLSAGKNILKISKSDLSEFINHTSSAFFWQADHEGINFNVISSEELICYFDRDLVEKVIYNLLSNAFKYTPVNGIVEIKVKPIWKNDRKIVSIIIQDSGKGIPDEQKGKIFERYFHDNERTSTGIGLHLSNSLIKAHKGELIVADSPYGGAEFIVSIPISKNSYEDFEFYTEIEKTLCTNDFLLNVVESKKMITEKRESILIVEDDHDLRIYLKNCLINNYNVIEAHNGVEGLKSASENLPDIIISDVMMPEMDGIEMCEKLKSNMETSHIPILMLTAKNVDEHQSKGLNAGAWDYITKPFNTQLLLQKIDNIVASRKQFREKIFNQNTVMKINKHYTPFDQKFLTKAIKIIEENMNNEKFTIQDFSTEVGFSRMQLHRKLKSLVGQSTTEFINSIKINYATKMFDNGCDRINEAMDVVGINSNSHFNKLFKKINEKTPSEYISGIDKKL